MKKYYIIVFLLIGVISIALGYSQAEFSSEDNKFNIDSYDISTLQGNENSKKIKIAILDTGIDKEHVSLSGKVKEEINIISPGEKIYDSLGHGTAVAGIIAASNNEIGIAPNSELYSVKVLDENGKGTIENVIKGIEWAIEKDVDIINLSFGFSQDKAELKETIDKAIAKGIIVVASAGNMYGLNVQYPAAYKNVISVAAVDQNQNAASFTARGKIDFTAVGVDVKIIAPNNTLQVNSGTSLAAPYVTGVIALILQNKDIFPKEQDKENYLYVYETLKNIALDGSTSRFWTQKN